MFSWVNLFWCAFIASIAVCGSAFVGLWISDFYHPMEMRGDLLFPLRQWAVAVPIITAIVVYRLWLRPQPLGPRVYITGLSLLALTMLLPVLPNLDSGYRQTYWLDESKHEIPWQYGPYNGSLDRGGKFFLVKVSIPDLVPRYDTQDKTIIIGKAVGFNHGQGGSAPDEMCTTNYSNMECQWRHGEFVFRVSGAADLFPSDISELMVSVADLLDSFEVPAP